MIRGTASLPPLLRDVIVTPDDSRYGLLRSTYTTVGRPAAVLLPRTTAEVSAALAYTRDQGLGLAVRSGGHGLSGHSTNVGGNVIDLSSMNAVEIVDPETNLVRVSAGARWAQVAKALEPHGLAISSGDHGNVGVGGLATAGGIGWLVRRHGLTIDHVRAVEMVLADGTVVRADEDTEPELFWAVRGAGAGIGIVTSFDIQASEVTDVGYAQIVVEADRDGTTLRRWDAYLAEASRELSTAVTLMPHGRTFAAAITAIVASDSRKKVSSAVEPLLGIGRVLDHSAGIVPYSALVPTAHLHPNRGQMPAETTNGLLNTMTAASARAVMATAGRGAMVQLRSLGGAINDVDADATAYPHRHQSSLVIATTFPPDDRAALDAAFAGLDRHVDGAYVNFQSRPSRATEDRAYPGKTGRRVAEARRKYDPDQVFRP